MRRRLVVLGAAVAAISAGLPGTGAIAKGATTAAHAPAGVTSAPHRGYARVLGAPRLPTSARRVGPVAASHSISGAVALKPRDPAALAAAATAISDPHSAGFRRYLAQGRFAAKYGPAPATIHSVESVLRAAHVAVTSVSANRLLVRFKGTARAVDAAFHTRVATYELAGGRRGTATTTAVSLPPSIAAQVVTVTGLNTLARPGTSLKHATHPAKVKAVSHGYAHPAGAAAPCGKATKVAHELGGLTDDQIANSYGVTGLYGAGDRGAGQTIALYELEPFAYSDVKTFDRCYFGAARAAQMISRLHVVDVDGGSGVGPGSGESILDIEDASAFAPDATINVYEAPITNAGALDEYNAMVQDDSAQVISTSWGDCEANDQKFTPGAIQLENELFEQAAVQGQTVLSAAGDAGSDDCAGQAPSPVAPEVSADDPTSMPFVVGVGGTTIDDAKNRPAEHVWNDGNDGGAGGGGFSSVWSAPSWQEPALTAADRQAQQAAIADQGAAACPQAAGSGGDCRESPDVSAQADEFTGAITVYAAKYGGWTTFGGTSSSAPLWAGMLADINASAACAGSPVGFVAPSLYAIAANSTQGPASFNDVTAGNNDAYDISGGTVYRATTGFDMASGLGTPELSGPHGEPGLAAYLCSESAPAARPAITGSVLAARPAALTGSAVAARPALTGAAAAARPVITGLTPAVEPVHPGSGALVVAGSGFTGATGVSVGGYLVPPADFKVASDSEIDVSPVPSGVQAQASPQGSGRVNVTVTGSSGASSAPTSISELLYVDESSAGQPVPSVIAVSPYGGSDAGGNKVTVYGSGFTTSGGDAVTHVSIGGIGASSYSVTSSTQLSVTIPPFLGSAAQCATGDNPATDVCQAQVVVSNANGSSATATIRPPYSGPAPDDSTCSDGSCELASAATEYDYFATPTITSISPNYVSEDPDNPTTATITGSGFDFLSTSWVNFGNPNDPDSQDDNVLFNSATKIEVVANPHEPTTEAKSVPVTVQGLGALSNAEPVTYAGVPRVTGLSQAAGPDTGGTSLRISGRGFEGSAPADGGSIAYSSIGFPIETDQLSSYTVTNDRSITATTPQSNPDTDIVEVCTVTGCSSPTSLRTFNGSLFTFYPTGDPVITSLSVSEGPASGGTKVIIHGENLSGVKRVTFGDTVASAHNGMQLFTGGSSERIIATSPPGTPGETVAVTVTTVESQHGGAPSAPTSAARYSYTPSPPSPPRHVIVHGRHRTVTVTWEPPTTTGGSAITGYEVRAAAPSELNLVRQGQHTPPPTIVTTGAGARRATLNGLRAGWTYRFTVRAINKRGTGPASSPARIYAIRQAA